MFFNKISQVSKLGLIYQFCGAKMYVPLRPLINDKNLVYVEKTFKKEGRQSKVKTYYYYILPLLVFMNNYFTSWSILNTGLFAITSVFGLFARLIIKIFCSGNVLALQMSHDMKNFYLIVPKMALNYKFMKHTNSINNYEELVQENFINGYNPFFQLFPNGFEEELQHKKKGIKMRFFRTFLRINLHESQISQTRFYKTQKKELQANKQKLSMDQLFRKYEDKVVQFLVVKDGKTYPFRVNLKENSQKKYNDYLISMALGIPIKENRVMRKHASPEDKQNQSQN